MVQHARDQVRDMWCVAFCVEAELEFARVGKAWLTYGQDVGARLAGDVVPQDGHGRKKYKHEIRF